MIIFNFAYLLFNICDYHMARRGSRQDMAAMASPQSPTGIVTHGDPRSTLMEDPDVWRPT